VISYCGLFFIFPKTNPAARWKLELSRDAAINRAEAVASDYGFMVSKRTDDVIIEYKRDDEFYLSRQANPLLDSLLTPLTARIRMVDHEITVAVGC
jgi:Tfp pilus assembly PilM family ATPase